MTPTVVGRSVPRIDLRDKLTGDAKYTADLKLPGMLVGLVLRSPHPHADILSIDTSQAAQLPGVYAIVTPLRRPAGSGGAGHAGAGHPGALRGRRGSRRRRG